MKRAVFAIVDNYPQAQAIVEKLEASGFSFNDISLLVANTDGNRDLMTVKSTKAPEATVAGVAAGGAIGGLAGWLAAVGSLTIPGLGPLIAAGPILAALSGAAIGAGVGGLSGALAGLGIPEFEAKQYEGKLWKGNVLISVHVESSDQEKSAKKVLKAFNANDVCASEEVGVPKR